jgi:hypothetical protein
MRAFSPLLPPPSFLLPPTGTWLALPSWWFIPGGLMSVTNAQRAEIVADPVSHISISGVHGRDELDDRLANAPDFRPAGSRLTPLLVGAAIGAAIVYLLKRD